MKKKVFLYCRRSSEGEDKQMLSIPSQVKELNGYASKLDLSIVKLFEESMSAKAPGRPKFAEMMAGLANKEAEGILCWKLDRLARNPVDGGAITWAMKDLKVEIITPGHTYSQVNEDGLLMYLEFGMAQKFIDDLGKNSQRGMRTKAEMGWYPAPAPLGYKNTPDKKKGFKIIDVDDNRFFLVRKLFDEILAGKQAFKVYKEASEVWQLTTNNNMPLSKSTFYSLLTKPFYYGEYEWPQGSGVWHQGKHQPMITHEEFDIVQRYLGKYDKPIAHSHNFDLTGIFRCSKCNCAVTATKKTKYYSSTNNTATYVYYHCTKKKKSSHCDFKPLTESSLNLQISNLLLSIKPDEEFISWAKRWLSVVHKDQSTLHEETLKSQQRALEATENRLNRLLDMRLSDLLDDESYKEKKKELELEKRDIENKLTSTSHNLDDGRLKVENALDFAFSCQKRFEIGSREIKQEIMMRIGENLMLNTDKKLEVTLKREFGVLSKKDKWDEQYKDWLEPQEYTDILSKNKDLRPANPVWLPRQGSNLRHPPYKCPQLSLRLGLSHDPKT